MKTPDEALIASLTEASEDITNAPTMLEQMEAHQKIAAMLPRLIELAREALASRAVVEAAKARARWEKKPDDMRETVYGVLEAEAKAVLRNALLTLASATRKEDGDGK